jgi:hypothetical protein
MLSSFYFNQEGSGFKFGNIGLGPARVKWFQVFVDETPMPDWKDMLRAIGIDETGFIFAYPQPIYPTDSYNILFKVEAGPADNKLRNEAQRIRLVVCYCSIFDECWIGLPGARPPRPVKQCEPPPNVTMGGRPGTP